jgi:predicted NAD/FAD-binding protein
VLGTFRYHHPVFSRTAVLAQRRHAAISGQNRTHFCGAYWGFGFHEDGVQSALAVGRHFGKAL